MSDHPAMRDWLETLPPADWAAALEEFRDAPPTPARLYAIGWLEERLHPKAPPAAPQTRDELIERLRAAIHREREEHLGRTLPPGVSLPAHPYLNLEPIETLQALATSYGIPPLSTPAS